MNCPVLPDIEWNDAENNRPMAVLPLPTASSSSSSPSPFPPGVGMSATTASTTKASRRRQLRDERRVEGGQRAAAAAGRGGVPSPFRLAIVTMATFVATAASATASAFPTADPGAAFALFPPPRRGAAGSAGIVVGGSGFVVPPPLLSRRRGPPSGSISILSTAGTRTSAGSGPAGALFAKDESLEEIEEESRLKVLSDRRWTIRGVLRFAEGIKSYRSDNDYVPELDENGDPIKTDAQSAIGLTAFLVAAGAVTLRVGGRAALVSALGLDFVNDNPELAQGIDKVMSVADGLGVETELGLFILAWTAVKVLCFDAGGVALALSSGILFGGVFQGAVVSAFSATVGSSVAFGLAKMDTPARTKALEVVEEYPSLRGIEKVVARDGIKAILTLRLAPVLPIPIGLYNYVYGVTNVPYLDFAGGIFLGSLKPYLLDSYIGVFGMSVVDGSAAAAEGGMQDVILLVALGVSVLIGAFASQLANETFLSINKEVEAEKAARAAENGGGDESDKMEGVTTEFMGLELPQALVGFQLNLKAADERVNDMITAEHLARVWNYTDAGELERADAKEAARRSEPTVDGSGSGGIAEGSRPLDPARWKDSPETLGANTGFDFGASICDGLVLSPALLGAILMYADPLYKETDEVAPMSAPADVGSEASAMKKDLPTLTSSSPSGNTRKSTRDNDSIDEELLHILKNLRIRLQTRLNDLE